MNQKELEVWANVQAMNRCWTGGTHEELERLTDYFHKTMVAITPTDRFRIEGRDACVAGWSGFAHAVTIDSWLEKEPKIQIYNETAIVTYYFEMACGMGGGNVRLEGRDMLTLVKENGRWQVVADQFSPYPM